MLENLGIFLTETNVSCCCWWVQCIFTARPHRLLAMQTAVLAMILSVRLSVLQSQGQRTMFILGSLKST